MAGLGNLKALLGELFGRPTVTWSPAVGSRSVIVHGRAENNLVVTGDVSISLAPDIVRTNPTLPLHQLPADIADFAGRAAQVKRLLDLFSVPGGRAVISAIDGMAGLGKTTLAVHVAHQLTGRYPDGQIVVDMAATISIPLSPTQALARVIRAFEPTMQLPDTVPELRPIYLHVLRGKRVLVLLDNAVDGDQVAPLLPPEDCALIVTSRRRIAVAGLERVDLDLLAPHEAAGLLRTIVGDDRGSASALSRIAELCGLLPLALRVAGMFLVVNPHWSAPEYIEALADERERLKHLKLDGGTDLDLAASLALSVRELCRTHSDLADHWHELAVFPSSFDTLAAASVWDQPLTAARDGLGMLLSRSMVLYDEAQQRWRLHDLMRDLAGGHAAAITLKMPTNFPPRLAAARRRHARHYCSVFTAAGYLYRKGGEQVVLGLALFDRERRNIEAGQTWAADCGVVDPLAERLCMRYALASATVLSLRQLPRHRIAWLETAATVARRINDRSCECTVLGNLGDAYRDLGEPRRAIEFFEQQLTIARDIGDRNNKAGALGNLGIAYMDLSEHHRAIEFFEEVLAIAREISDRRREGVTLGNLGIAYAHLSEPRCAIEFFEQGLKIARETGDRCNESNTLGSLGLAYKDLGELRRAVELFEQCLTIVREIGDRRAEGHTLSNLGLAYAELGELRRATDFFEQSLLIAREADDRSGEGSALGNLGIVYGQLGELHHAIECFKLHVSIAREIGDRYGEGNALGNLGLAYVQLDKTRHAIEFFELHVAIARETGDRRGEGIALNNLGNAYNDLREPRRAVEFLRHAQQIFDTIESPLAARVRATIADLEK